MEKVAIIPILKKLGLQEINYGSSTGQEQFGDLSQDLIASYSPVDGSLIAKVSTTTAVEYERIVTAAQVAFKHWKNVPAPERG